MFGLDFRLLKLDLLLEHKRVTSIYVKYGQIRTCCLGTSSSQSGAFLLLDEQHKVELMRGDVEIEIMSKNSSIIGMGRATGCHLSDALVMATITSVPTFQYIGGALVDMQIVRSTPGKPDIILGTAQLSICMYQLLVRKTCNCEDFTKREEDRFDIEFNTTLFNSVFGCYRK